MPGGGPGQPGRAGAVGVDGRESGDPVQVPVGIGRVLIDRGPDQAVQHHRAGRGRELPAHPLSLTPQPGTDQRGRIGRGDLVAAPFLGLLELLRRDRSPADGDVDRAPGARRRRRRCPGRFEAGRECAQRCLDTLAGCPNRVLEPFPLEGQRPGAGQGPEQGGADDAACLSGERTEVGADQLLGRGHRCRQQGVGVDPAVAQLDLLSHRVDPVGGGDQGGAVRRAEPALDRPAGFHQLRGDDDVHLARRGEQAEHRLWPATRRNPVRLGWVELHVIDGRPGALGHARDRGVLGGPAGLVGHGHHPVGEDAATFTAHGQDGQGDRPAAGLPASHQWTSNSIARRSRPRDAARTQRVRTAASARSRRVGLRMVSVR